MIGAYMEMIYIASDGLARQTNVGAQMETDELTLDNFNSHRYLGVEFEAAKFLLYYHDANGDLIDAICLDERGFEMVCGEKSLTAADYDRIDAEYWASARARRTAGTKPQD